MKMKFNWKVLVAIVVILGVGYWAFDSMRTNSYSGANLTFGVGSGPVTITNASDAPIAAQLVGTGSRVFSVASDTEGVSGASVRQGTGATSTQLYDFMLPAGESIFTVTRGTAVNFIASEGSTLGATVASLTPDAARTTLIAAAVVILGALFFISYTTEHAWIGMLRGVKPVEAKPVASATSADGGQGRALKSYGDNSG